MDALHSLVSQLHSLVSELGSPGGPRFLIKEIRGRRTGGECDRGKT